MEKIQFIGTIHSTLKTLEDCPLQENENAPQATVEIFSAFSEGSTGLTTGSEMILFTWLNKADRTILSTHPRNNTNIPKAGVFLTRSPDRPNPIGIHYVKVISVLPDGKFQVSGLEVLDKTPLVDMKPKL